MGGEEIEAAAVPGVLDEVVVGLVEEDGGRGGDPREKRGHLFPRHDRAGGVVGVADVDKPSRGVARGGHPREVVPEGAVQWHPDHVRSGHAVVEEDGFVGRLRDDQIAVVAEKGPGGHAKDVARAAPEQDLLGCHSMSPGHRRPQLVLLGIGVAAGDIERAYCRLARGGGRPVRVLVGVELDRVGRLADRDARLGRARG